MAGNAKAGEYTNAVERALDILEYMALKDQGVSVSEISTRFGINRTSIYSILKVLISKGYVRKVSDGKFNLTGRMFEYGVKFRNSFPIVAKSKNIAGFFKSEYPCTMNVAMYFSGDSATVMSSTSVDNRSQNNITDRTITTGQSVPLYATSLGKVILAYMAPAESKKILDTLPLVPYTEKTITDVSELKRQMHEAVERGYATEEGEMIGYTFCAAAPVFNQAGEFVAALSLSCNQLYADFNRDAVIKDVQNLAKMLSISLNSN